MKAVSVFFAIILIAFAFGCTYMYFTVFSFHFGLFAVCAGLLSYSLINDYRKERAK
jgi:hypothetical protein